MQIKSKDLFKTLYSYEDVEFGYKGSSSAFIPIRIPLDMGTHNNRGFNSFRSREIYLQSDIASELSYLIKEKGENFRFIYSLMPRPFVDCKMLREFVDWSIKEHDNLVNFSNTFGLNMLSYNKFLSLDKRLRNTMVPRWIANFFIHDEGKPENIFRWIEINEFIERGRPEQSFEDFLLNDSKVSERAGSMEFIHYGSASEKIASFRPGFNVPKIFEFGKSMKLKTRKLVLSLTQEQLRDIIVNIDKNPHRETKYASKDSHDYAEMFFLRSKDTVATLPQKELSIEEIKLNITSEILSRKDYWLLQYDYKSYVNTLDQINSNLASIFGSDDFFIKLMSYFISEKAFEKLEVREIVQSVIAIKDPRRAVLTTNGLDPRILIFLKLANKEADPVLILKILAKANEERTAVVIPEDFDWTVLANTPASWAVSLFERKDVSLKHLWITKAIV